MNPEDTKNTKPEITNVDPLSQPENWGNNPNIEPTAPVKRSRKKKTEEFGDELINHCTDPGRTTIKVAMHVLSYPGKYYETTPTHAMGFSTETYIDVIAIFDTEKIKTLIQNKEILPKFLHHVEILEKIDEDAPETENNKVIEEYFFVVGSHAAKYDSNHALISTIFNAGNTTELLEKMPIFLGFVLGNNMRRCFAESKISERLKDKIPTHMFNIALTKGMQNSLTFLKSQQLLESSNIRTTYYIDSFSVEPHIVYIDRVTISTHLQGSSLFSNIVLDDKGLLISNNKIFQTLGNTPEEMANSNSVLKKYFEDEMVDHTCIIDVGSETGGVLFTKGLDMDLENTYPIISTPNKVMEKVKAVIQRQFDVDLDIQTIQNRYFVPNKKYKDELNTRECFITEFDRMDMGEAFYKEIRQAILTKKTRTSNFDLKLLVIGGGIVNSFSSTINSPYIDAIAFKIVKEFIDVNAKEEEPSSYMKYILPHGLYSGDRYLINSDTFNCSTAHVDGFIKQLAYNINQSYPNKIHIQK